MTPKIRKAPSHRNLVHVTIRAYADDDYCDSFECQFERFVPLRKLANLWSDVRRIPLDAIRLCDKEGADLELFSNPCDLHWSDQFLVYAVLLDCFYAEKDSLSSDCLARILCVVTSFV